MQDSGLIIGRRNPKFCEDRGFHGPFRDTEKYDRVESWQGFGLCLTCGSVRYTPNETVRRQKTLGVTEERSPNAV